MVLLFQKKFAECQHFDYPCYRQRRCWKIFHYQFSYWGASCSSHRFPSKYFFLFFCIPGMILLCYFRFHKLELSLHIFFFASQSEALRPVMVSRSWAGFTLNVIDTPGLVEAGYVNHQALELIKGSVLELSCLVCCLMNLV